MHPLCLEILEGASPSFDDLYEGFRSLLPILDHLKDTPQDPEWHAEGDVHIHSRMTVDALYTQLDESASDLEGHARLQLILGTALHDIAKAFTTREADIDGRSRIVAPKHAQRGRSYLGMLLSHLELEWRDQREILALVGYHHDPRRLVQRGSPQKLYWRLNRLVDQRLLYELCLADINGRVSETQSELHEDLELFRLLWEEHIHGVHPSSAEWREVISEGVRGYPELTQAFVQAQSLRDAEAGLIYTPHEALARSYQYRDQFAHLIIGCGPSGLGKSTWLLKRYPEAEFISMDLIRREVTGSERDQSQNRKVFQLALGQLKVALAKKRQVVWDATCIRKEQRQRLVELGENYKAFTSLFVFVGPTELALSNNKSRDREVKTKVIERQYQKFEWPTEDEAHQVTYVMRD